MESLNPIFSPKERRWEFGWPFRLNDVYTCLLNIFQKVLTYSFKHSHSMSVSPSFISSFHILICPSSDAALIEKDFNFLHYT